jgi:hypothetical protein
MPPLVEPLDIADVRAQLDGQSSTASLAAQYTDDPVGFAVHRLGVTPWSRQVEVMRAMRDHRRVAVRSGHKTGKSCLAAILALWWWATKPDARCVLFATRREQIRSVLWREIRARHRRAVVPLGGVLSDTVERGLVAPDGREIFGIATDEPEKAAGISGENLFFIVDEASGVEESMFETIFGTLTGGGKLLLIGNPTRQSGTFADAFRSGRSSKFWHTVHISSEETPNVIEGKSVIPGLATREDCEQMAEEWGRSSPLYQIRVAGNFANETDGAVIPYSLVEAARDRYDERIKDFERAGQLHLAAPDCHARRRDPRRPGAGRHRQQQVDAQHANRRREQLHDERHDGGEYRARCVVGECRRMDAHAGRRRPARSESIGADPTGPVVGVVQAGWHERRRARLVSEQPNQRILRDGDHDRRRRTCWCAGVCRGADVAEHVEVADAMTAICRREGCITCREIVVGLLAQELRTVPEELRAGVCVDAMKAAKAHDAVTHEAELVAEQIG